MDQCALIKGSSEHFTQLCFCKLTKVMPCCYTITYRNNNWKCNCSLRETCWLRLSVLPGPAVIQSQRITQRSISIINWFAQYLRLFLLTNSYNLHWPIILICISHVARYLFWQGSHILLSLKLDHDCRLKLPSSQNSCCHASTSCMVTRPILSACLLANQHFIKK